MASDQSNNVPVTTFIAIGTLVGLFIVFQGTRLGDDESLDGETPTPQRLVARGASEGPKTCLSADCSVYRQDIKECDGGLVDPLGRLPAQDEDDASCHITASICTTSGCVSEVEVRSRADFQSAMRRIGARTGEHWQWASPVQVSRGAKVRVELDARGEIRGIDITASSGNREFDASVRRAVEQAQPFTEIQEVSEHSRGLLQRFQLTFGRPSSS
jgi:TonB family protein